MTRKTLLLAYGAGAYILALANVAYIIGFLADFGVPKGIGDGTIVTSLHAAMIDAALVGLFGLHHSITARASFKRWWTRFIPPPIERATYLYMTAAMTAALVLLWRPIPLTLWEVQSPWLAAIIHGIYLATCVMMVAATFHFGHFGFFGLAQAWQNFRASPPKSPDMTTRYLYALVRHPISLGWMILPFLTPHFTLGHLVFAGATFGYIVLATPFEEADLVESLGDDYRAYRRRVPAFVPFARRRKKPVRTPPAD